MESKSLNKYISETGICSRREADKLILAGKVTLNGEVARLGNRVAAGDIVLLNGQPVIKDIKTVYIALYKPVGITCTTDLKDPDNIIDYLKYDQRIFPIGRLDKDSEGLILLTNDGDIVNKILRAGNNHEKEYIVTVDKPIDERFITQMSSGIPILDTITFPCNVEKINELSFRITLIQGLNRQIRRMCSYLGYSVKQLVRIRIMNIRLDNIPYGTWRYLTGVETEQLLKLVNKSENRI
ncbi:MAG: 23S rRNA pseudouridine(2604) synthase RluF [Saprospiraceae bacterium]|nr:23S rRNA pseudouridine(2604) synthase RluF [Saprospiraceae bacterium]